MDAARIRSRPFRVSIYRTRCVGEAARLPCGGVRNDCVSKLVDKVIRTHWRHAESVHETTARKFNASDYPIKDRTMNERRKILLISLMIMTCVALVAGAISLVVQYDAAFEHERERLVETVQSRARLIESVAEFDAVHSTTDISGGSEAATLSQVVRAHERFRGFGETGEFTLARQEGDKIVFLLRHRHFDLENPRPVPFNSELAEPMRRALSGESGTVIGLDYRGEKVLAAYEPVGIVGWGVVCKIDLSEIRRVFVRAGLAASSVGALVILAGAFLLLRSAAPLIERLESSEAQTLAILETAADGIITIDEGGIVRMFNSAAERIFGFSANEVVGKNINMLIPPPHKDRHNDYIARYVQTGEARVVGKRVELEGQRKDESIFSLEAAVSEVKMHGRRLFTGVFRDITERKRLEKEILQIGQREQQRIGQDLHDTMGQHLTGAAFRTKALEKKLAEQALPEAESALQISRLINEAIAQARALAKGLYPVELTSDGLMSALREHAASVEALFKVRCSYRCDEPVLVEDNTVAVNLFRIAQEAITNAIKHSQARQIELVMVLKDGKPSLTVRDDGVGIPDRFDTAKGMGLRIMGQRAKMIGAELSMGRNPAGGTVVTCSF